MEKTGTLDGDSKEIPQYKLQGRFVFAPYSFLQRNEVISILKKPQTISMKSELLEGVSRVNKNEAAASVIPTAPC